MAGDSKTVRDAAVAELRALEGRKFGANWEALPIAERRRVNQELDTLHDRYFQSLPMLTISRCPYDERLVQKRMDLFGMDGPWWESGAYDDPPIGDPHVVTYLGALKLNNLAPADIAQPAGYQITPGPEVPYVIPRLLAIPGMKCVIASAVLFSGCAAYFMTYFAEPRRPAAESHQQWLRDTFYYVDPQGFRRWNSCNDEWDFDLAKWIDGTKGQIFWVTPGDASFTLVSGPAEKCPYTRVQGAREPRSIVQGKISPLPLPSGGTIADCFD
jgi:hypothetical protein